MGKEQARLVSTALSNVQFDRCSNPLQEVRSGSKHDALDGTSCLCSCAASMLSKWTLAVLHTYP